MTRFERKAARISEKDWATVRSLWSRYLPGQYELEGLFQWESQLSVIILPELAEVREDGEHRFLPKLHPASTVFMEALWFLHKAVRVSCTAGRQVEDGLATWSISTAYQGAMFSLRALLGFVGIGYFDYSGAGYLVDVAPGPRKGRRRGARKEVESPTEVQLMSVPMMGHKEWWLLFQRLQRVWRGFEWLDGFEEELASCAVGSFAKQRNDLHYRLTWYFADLVDADPRPSSFGLFGVPSEPGIVGRLSDRRGSDGVLLLNGLLVRSCIALLGRLASTSRQLEPVLYRLRDVLERFDTAVVGSWSADPDLWRTSS